jgi:hypothetical protein
MIVDLADVAHGLANAYISSAETFEIFFIVRLGKYLLLVNIQQSHVKFSVFFAFAIRELFAIVHFAQKSRQDVSECKLGEKRTGLFMAYVYRCVLSDFDDDYLNFVRIRLNLLENTGLTLLFVFMNYNSNLISTNPNIGVPFTNT